MNIRQNIRKMIAAKGFRSVREFAKYANISYVYLNAILNKNRRLNEDFLGRIASALGVPLYQLLSEEPLIPYSQIKKHAEPSEIYEQIKFFSDPLSLGPGVEISEIPPSIYSPSPGYHVLTGKRKNC